MQIAEQNTSALLLELFDKFIMGDVLCEVSLEREEDKARRRCWGIDRLYGVIVRVSVEKLASHTLLLKHQRFEHIK